MSTRVFVVACSCLVAPAIAGAQSQPELLAARHRIAWAEHYQENKAGPEVTERWEKVFKIGPTGTVDLSNLAGDIVVTAVEGGDARVQATKRARAKDGSDARAQLAGLTIDANESPGRVEVRTVFPRGKNLHVWVDFDVQVPVQASVAIRSLSGDISVTKVKGEVRLESVSGDIIAVGTPHLAKVKSVSGDVELNGAGSSDALSAGTVSGNLTVRGLKARVLDLATVSGDLTLVDTSCERAQVRSINGNLEFGGPLAKNGRYEFTSHSGDVRLWMSGPTGFEVSASSFSGDVRSEVPLSGSQPEPPQGPQYGPTRRELRGSFGDGSAYILVKTFSGTVTLSGKAGKPESKDKAHYKGKVKEREKVKQ